MVLVDAWRDPMWGMRSLGRATARPDLSPSDTMIVLLPPRLWGVVLATRRPAFARCFSTEDLLVRLSP